jgi:hypothetical protein
MKGSLLGTPVSPALQKELNRKMRGLHTLHRHTERKAMRYPV